MTITEKRELPDYKVEIRESEEGVRTVEGYAVKWDTLSQKLGYWRRFQEQFNKGAFTNSLANFDQRALWSHDTNQVLGRTKNGTLRLTEDEVGLRFEIDLPNSPMGDNAYESIKRGDVDGVSFGFRQKVEEWDEKDPDNIVRTVKEADLFEISPTGFPAYQDSEVDVRSEKDPYKTYSDDKLRRKKLQLKTLC
ncbi:peptidase U35 [Paenibacillus sp. FSL H8-0548]|uniref:HK97 family phage prohead protease n=1 Tax=Paenibacillus sp. FSL H8-0548 TaxID=1920422 RepID=UPI00096E4195|nr:HK97 family phage prohead protease [Paenibacillus sp. FSL H8-0548]OMF35270.1 peptidase U35 [Paenibacillus sp. FSL H8-0548]